jgi:threonine dehydrogenase-like Zn-dependent dehydrogenase
VVGAGPLGHLCARVLALEGHQVTVFDHDSERLKYFAGSDIETSNELARLEEFEHLVEATGNPDALDTLLLQSPAGATILLLGLPYGHRQFTFESIVAFDKIVVGSVGSEAKHFEKAIELLPRIKTAAFKEKLMPLHKFRRAWNLVQDHKYLKIIFEINKPSVKPTAER